MSMSGLSNPRLIAPRKYGGRPRSGAMALIALMAAIAVTLVAGCSLVPVYQQPPMPLSKAFDGAANATLADTVPVRSGWWRAYREPALDALIDRSLQHSFTLASAIAPVEQARGHA